MTPRRSLRIAIAASAVSLLALTGCSTGGSAAASSASPSSAPTPAVQPLVGAPSPSSSAAVEGDAAVVVRVVDGDTVDVRKDGDSADTRVRLLNIDTPETKHPSKAVQCMGPEATRRLESVLAAGDRVTLQYDRERFDRYHRTLAGVFEGTTLVNAEIARAGLGVPVVFEPNRRFYPEVLAAWNEAKDAGAGLHQPNLPCSLPAIAGQQTLGEPPAAGVADELALAYGAAVSGDQEWMQVLYQGDLPRVKRLVESHATLQAEAQRREGERRRQAERSAAAAAREEAAQQEAEREAAERRAAAQAEAEQEAAARAERVEQEAEASRAVAAEEESSSSEREARSFADTSGGSSAGSEGESSSGSSGGSSNKAPNRCYAPGGETFEYCDDQDSSSSSSGSSDESAPASSGGDGGPVAGSGGVCPDGYPVKVSSSGKYHVPSGQYYDKTSAKNCYASTAAAAAAGYVASKR